MLSHWFSLPQNYANGTGVFPSFSLKYIWVCSFAKFLLRFLSVKLLIRKLCLDHHWTNPFCFLPLTGDEFFPFSSRFWLRLFFRLLLISFFLELSSLSWVHVYFSPLFISANLQLCITASRWDEDITSLVWIFLDFCIDAIVPNLGDG
jgi:hypothetical protein